MIDTVKIHSRDFEIAENPVLDQKTGVIDRSTGEVKNIFYLYRDRGGKDIFGAGEYLNHSKVHVDINSTGLYAKFTPAKNFFGCNYYSVNNFQLEQTSQEVESILADHGIYFSVKDSTLSRIDLAKNIHTDLPVIAYSDLFSFLSGKRMKSTELPGGYWRYGNRSRQVVFYDKLQELLDHQKIDLHKIGIPCRHTLRTEPRWLKASTIKRDLPCTKLGELYIESNYNDLRDCQKHYLKELVFRSGPDNDDLKYNMMREVDLLREMKSKTPSGRGGLSRYLRVTGVDEICNIFGSLDKFRSVLIEVGYHEKSTFRYIRELQEDLNIKSKIYKKHKTSGDSLSSLYEEVYKKLLN